VIDQEDKELNEKESLSPEPGFGLFSKIHKK